MFEIDSVEAKSENTGLPTVILKDSNGVIVRIAVNLHKIEIYSNAHLKTETQTAVNSAVVNIDRRNL